MIGLGPVGLMAMARAQVMGAARVLAIDLVASRRRRRSPSAPSRVEASTPAETVAAAHGRAGCRRRGRGRRADATIGLSLDLAGAAAGSRSSASTRTWAFPFPVVRPAQGAGVHIGLCSVQYELPTLLALTVAGRIEPERVVSHRLPLSQGPAAYELYDSRTDGVSKVVFDPWASA